MLTFRHKSHLDEVRSRMTAHRTLWDHSGLLAQLHLDPAEAVASGPAGLPAPP